MDKVIMFISSPSTILSAIVIAAALILWFVLKKLLKKYLGRSEVKQRLNGKRETQIKLFANLLKYIIFILAIVFVLQINGVNVSSLITGLGIASAIAGLALQDALKDLIMGANIMLDNFFVIGDVVRYGEVEGRVIAFSVKTTKLQDIETGDILTVCNRNISEITRLSDRFDIELPLSYNEDVCHVDEVMEQICEDVKEIKKVRDCKYLGTERFADSAIEYKLRIFCRIDNKPEIRREAMKRIQKRLKENEIEIPYDQYDLHIDDVRTILSNR